MFSQMRIARPVTDINRAFHMYSEGLGLRKIAEFNDHQGFSGIMLGLNNLSWHLEFTVCLHHPVKPSQTEEDLLVLYYPDTDEWQATCEKMITAGFIKASSFNSYWEVKGRTFIDPDGYRVILQNSAWG